MVKALESINDCKSIRKALKSLGKAKKSKALKKHYGIIVKILKSNHKASQRHCKKIAQVIKKSKALSRIEKALKKVGKH